MKRIVFAIILCISALVLTACGGNDKDNATASNGTAKGQEAARGAQAESAVAGTPLMTVAEAAPSSEAERPVDLDLTKISGTVVYSQVYDMMMNPDSYLGQKVRMKGSFSYFQDPETKQEYFAAIIADATACCAQGIEFEWKGAHTYPQDYPPLDTEITVTGTFSTYSEGEYMYLQLAEADVRWS